MSFTIKFTETDLHLFTGPFLRDPEGPVARDMKSRGRKLVALAKIECPKKTGHLAESIGMTFVPGLNPTVIVRANTRYAEWVHEGTNPHLITPNNHRYLRFVHRGRVVYARQVHHPGATANRFLTRPLRRVA